MGDSLDDLADGLALWQEHRPRTIEDWKDIARRFSEGESGQRERATRAEAALADIVRADTAKWESRTAHVHSVALNNAIARARSVLASSGPGDGEETT